jgi:hypothetical protein
MMRMMSAFRRFLEETAAKGEVLNLVFEERLFQLVGLLHRIAGSLEAAGVRYELVGGMAVLVHVEEADPSQSMLTRDVDLMIERTDLERVTEIAAKDGFRFRHAAGLDMLIFDAAGSARNAVHLIFSGEKVRPAQATPNPEIAPEAKLVHGKPIMVIPVAGLLRMKLSSYRLKDQVHVQVMDAAGLITPEVERKLPPELLPRLQHVRQSE